MKNIFIISLLITILSTNISFAMTPDEVSQAKDLLEKEADLQKKIGDLKVPNAEISIEIYIPLSDKESCNHDGMTWSTSMYTANGKEYCMQSHLFHLKVPPSLISDLEDQLKDIQDQLCKLGVHEKGIKLDNLDNNVIIGKTTSKLESCCK